MAAEITKRVQGTPAQPRLDVILGDVVRTELPYFDVCISNTPYQVCCVSKRVYVCMVLLTLSTDFLSSHIQTPRNLPSASNLHSYVSA